MRELSTSVRKPTYERARPRILIGILSRPNLNGVSKAWIVVDIIHSLFLTIREGP